MKRLFSIVIAAMLAGQAWAQTTFTSNGLKYTVTDNVNKTVSVSIDENNARATVNIPSTISYGNEDYTVTSIADYAFQGWTITSVVIPNTVISIGKNAFDECIALTSITIGNSVETIGDFAFISCAMTSITIPNSVISIGDRAFLECTAMTTISIGSSVSSIGDLAFGNCSKLTAISVDSDNTSFASENGVLFNKDKTTLICCPSGKTGSYSIPNSVTAISRCGFNDCRVLTGVTIPDAVTAIGENAFENCRTMLTITIPKDVETLGYNAFRNCNNLIIACIVAKKPDGWNENWNPNSRPVVWGYKPLHYEITSDTTVQVVQSNDYKTMTGVLIPETVEIEGTTYKVTRIGENAFSFCENLKSLNIPKSVTEIGSDALWVCSGLKEINVYGDNKTFSSVDGVLFNKDKTELIRCPEKKSGSYTIPNTVTRLDEDAFRSCVSLTILNFPESVIDFGLNTLYECRGLTEINVDDNNTIFSSVDGVLFNKDKTELIYCPENRTDTSYTIPNTVTSIRSGAFDDCRNLTEINIPNSVKSIGNFAFIGCASLKGISIPNGVTIIGGQTFQGCTSLSSVTIPQGVTNIGSYAFASCTSLKSITIPSSVIKIASNAFEGCSYLTDMNLEGNNYYSFENQTIFNKDKTELVRYLNSTATEYTIPNTVKRIGDDAFYQSRIASITIPESVTSIGSWAFQRCRNLTSITIPNSVTDIEDGAIKYCDKLESVILSESVKHIGSDNFSNCPKLVFNEFDNAYYLGTADNQYYALIRATSNNITSCTINSNCKIIADNAFAGCNQLATVSIPESVTIVGQYAFDNCDVLEYNEYDNAFYLGNNETQYLMLVKAKSTNITSCEINGDCQIIGEHAFDGCNQLSSITIPESVTSIGNHAFFNCKKLASISIPNLVTSIGNYAFYDCDGLQLVSIPESVTDIGDGVFYYCSNLKAVSVPKSVTSMGEDVFRSCYNLTLYCGAESKPSGWSEEWNPDNRPVVWNLGANLWLYTAKVKTNNNAYGSVSGGGIVANGSTTTIKATPATGYKFVKWSNGLTNASATITVTKDTTLTAEFAIKTYTVTVAANNSSYGTVDGGGTVNHGSTTTITATPANGYKFVKWSNGLTNASPTITVTKDTTLTAEFAIKTYIVTVAANNSSYGTVDGGGTVAEGSTTTIVATPATGYKFVKWSNGSTNASETITVTSDLTLTAEFAFIIPEGNQEIPENPIAETPADSTSFRFSILSSSEHTAEVSGYSGTSGNVVIPSKTKIDGVEYIVTAIGDQSFRNNSTVVSVTIPNTVTTIKSNAFRCCVNLEYVVIPSSVTTIGEGPFSERNKLTAIYVDSENTNFFSYDGVLYSADMKKLVQYPCSKSNSVFEIPNGVERVEYGAFSSCPNLISLVLPNSLKTIKWWAISGCGYMQSLVIPNSVTSIEGNGIRNCKNLTIYCEAESKPSGWSSSWNSDNIPVVWGYTSSSQEDFTFTITSTNDKTVEVSGYTGTNTNVVIPKKATIDGVEYTVTGVGRDAFWGSSISLVNIPSTVTNIDRSFNDCLNLTAINVAEDNTAYSSEKGVLFNKNKTTLVCFPAGKTGDYIIPSTVTTIAERGFRKCAGLTSVTIPDGVTSIGEFAFGRCTGLTSIVLPNSLKTLSTTMLAGCSSLESVTLGSETETIGEYAFQYCSSLTKITIPETVKKICEAAFHQCTGLDSIFIPNSVTTMEQWAFHECSNMTIYCEASSKPSGWDSSWNSSNRPVVWGTKQWKVTLLANNADYGTVTGGGSVANGSTITITATPATGCVFVKWSNGLTNASETITVTKDTTLTAEFIKVVIPELNECSFSVNHYTGCYVAEMATFTKGKKVDIPTGMVINDELHIISSISSKCFQNNTEIISIWIPPTVTVIRDSAFAGCKNLEITCAFDSKPSCWSDSWNPDNLPVVWVGMASSEELDAPTDSVSFSYSYYQSNHTAILTKYYGYSSTVAVPEKIIIKGEEYTVTTISSSCFQNNVFVASLSIPATVTNIEDKAFAGCRSMKINCAYSSKPSGWSNTWNPDNLPVEWGTVEPSNSNTEPPVASDFTYRILSSSYRTVEIAGYTGTKTDIALPTKVTIDGVEYTVTGVGRDAFWGSSITSVNIHALITNIDRSFNDCPNLTDINVAEDNTAYSSEKGVLFNKDKTTLVCCPAGKTGDYTIPSTVTTIAERGFRKCAGLTSVTIPDGVTSIGEFAFGKCTGLTSIVLPNSLKTLSTTMLAGCSSLESITLGCETETLGEYAFQYCSSLTKITIPETVKKICEAAFHQCTSLDSIFIPNSVTTMEKWAFHECSNLTIYCEASSKPSGWDSSWNSSNRPVVWNIQWMVTLLANNNDYGTVTGGGSVANGSTITITATPAVGYKFVKWSNGSTNASETITVTSDLTLTAEFAFIIPEGNQEIPENPIAETPADSTSFRFSILSSSEHTAEVSGYSGTSGNVVIPSKTKIDGVEYTVTAIGDQSFRDNSTIVSVTIPNTVTNIKSNAFRHCVNLEYVVIPSSVTTIGEGPFSDRNKLTAIYVDKENTHFVSYDGVLYSADMKKLVQYPCSKPNSVFEVPNSVESIEYLSFSSCPNLISLVLPNSLKTINWWAISSISSLKSLVIPNSVTYIEYYGIRKCKNLTIYCEADSKPSDWHSDWNYDGSPVVWGYSSSSQEDFTFTMISNNDKTVEVSGYTGTNTIVMIPPTVVLGGDEFSVVSIGYGAFKDCSNLQSVIVPNTITLIEDEAFRNCSSLESVSLPNTIDYIGSCTFAECSSLKSVEIPNTVTFIGNGAFAESGLTSIVIPNSVTDISSYAFQDCADLATVEIPNSVNHIGISAFENCSSLTEVKIPSSVSEIGMAAFKGCDNATFECEAESKPDGWDAWWNYDNRPVAWSDNTSVSESMANAVNIYAFDNTIVVENADDEIFVYDAAGRLVCRDAIHRVSAKITVSNAGIYVVKVGNTAKRVMIND